MAVSAEQVRDAGQSDDPSGLDDARRLSMAAVALAAAQDYNPDASDAVLLEASVRMLGWQMDQPKISLTRDATGQGGDRSYAVSRTGMIHASGAASILSIGREERAVACE